MNYYENMCAKIHVQRFWYLKQISKRMNSACQDLTAIEILGFEIKYAKRTCVGLEG